MKLLVLGNGFLGQEFGRHGHRVAGRDEFNFTDPMAGITSLQLRSLIRLINTGDYDAVVNCAGKANTRYCEDPNNWKEVYRSNVLMVEWLSDRINEIGKKFVHISTGCLYSYDGPDYKAIPETGHIETHCRYTVSKYVGETFCSDADLILRPRLLFSHIEHPANLICKLRGFTEFIGNFNSCTSTETVVRATEALVGANQSGVFNVAQNTGIEIRHLAGFLGKTGNRITASQLREKQGLYLVNNVLDIGKLQKFYWPRNLSEEFIRCRDLMEKKPVASVVG